MPTIKVCVKDEERLGKTLRDWKTESDRREASVKPRTGREFWDIIDD